jgi:hypothetical protein
VKKLSYAAFVLLAEDRFPDGKKWWRGSWESIQKKAKEELAARERNFEEKGYIIKCARVLESTDN